MKATYARPPCHDAPRASRANQTTGMGWESCAWDAHPARHKVKIGLPTFGLLSKYRPAQKSLEANHEHPDKRDCAAIVSEITQTKGGGEPIPTSLNPTILLTRFGRRFRDELAELVTATSPLNGSLESFQIELLAFLHLEPDLLRRAACAQCVRINPSHFAQCGPHLVRAG